MQDRRPPRLVRLLVLVGAIACLGLAMCAHGERPARSPSYFPATKAASQVYPVDTTAPDAAPAPREDPAYFPATKAAGPIYPQQQGD